MAVGFAYGIMNMIIVFMPGVGKVIKQERDKIC